MNKDKILEHARNEKLDEGIDNARNKGFRAGYIMFLLLIAVLMIFNIFNKQTNYDLMSLAWGFVTMISYSRYKFSHEKIDLVSFMAALVACLGFLLGYFSYICGW